MKRSLKKGLPGGPNEKVFSKEGYRSTSPDVNNPFNIIPSGNITMKEKDGTPLKKGPLLGIDNLGNSQLMLPGANYQFPGDVVKEVPLAKKGGPFQNSNIYATNKLFAKNPLFKKRKKGKKAKGIYNPKAKYTYDDGGESGCPDGKVWSNKFKKCVHLIQHEDYFNSPSMNNYGDVPVISSDPIQSLGDLGPDGLTENILEFFDPTGRLSWDDARESYNKWQNAKNTYPTFNQALSMFGAVPVLGKLSKIKYLKNIGPFSKAAFGVIPWQQILNAIDTGQDIKKDNINPSIKKTKKSEWNPPLIKREVVVKPKKAFGRVQVAKYGFELDLTEDEIQKYVKGGYVVEDISIPSLTRMDDGGTNTCPPDHYWNGEACVPTGRTYTPIDPNYLAQHPDEARRIINEGEVSIEREGSDIGKLRAEFREKNPMDTFLDEKKRQYLKKNKGLNKAAGVTMENFPEDVLQNFMNEYDYKTNNYAVNKLGKKEGWNPKRRGEWVDELTPGERDAVAESKYGSKLQPSYWSRSLAGVQELGNEVIKLLPGEQGDVMKFNIPGLTKKEQKEIRESKLGALETLAPMDMQGAWLANVAKNTGLSTGSDYKELPGILSTEKMPNVDDTDALALNLGTYAGLEALPELGISLARGIGRGISAAPEAISNLGKFITKEAPLNKIDNVVDVRAKVLESIPKDAPYVMSDELLPDYKTFKTKGRSITYDEGIDLLEDMTKKYPVLQESPRVPVYYHGTTSASLPGIIKNEGLVPVGELIREGKVPLTGELGSGVAGINNSSISTAMARGHQGALDYAIGLSGKNKVNIEDDLAKWFERGGRESFVESSYGPDISFYDDLKNKRLTEWQNLSDAEKALVQDNFPVMFGINPTKGNAQRFVIPRTDVSDEVGISGKINFEEIPSIFVPKSKVASVQEQLGTKTKVLPIEDFMQNYKNADKYNQMGYAKGGIVSNLTKKEIDKLIKQGYIIEEID